MIKVVSECQDSPHTWHDVALFIAAGLMKKAKEEVKQQLGYTTSAVSCDPAIFVRLELTYVKGIARNKFLAKVIFFVYLHMNFCADFALALSFLQEI